MIQSRPAFPPRPRGTLRWVFGLLVGVLWCAGLLAGSQPIAIDIPAGDAGRTLRVFARQARVQLVYPAGEVRGLATRRVSGYLSVRAALDLMLVGSGLEAVQDPATGAYVVRRIPPTPPGLADAHAARKPEPGAATPSVEDPVVVLSPFEVRTQADRGYRPANAVSATRVSTTLRELPMIVSVFTEAFIADQKPYDLYDVVKWTPGVHQDNISPQGWARYSVRGYTSASIQRNGFGSFRFIDTTNISRVEVVKGPASLLYGQINPGGVINYVTKRPEPRAMREVSASAGTHGHFRLVGDATGPVSGTDGALLVRAVAMTESIPRFRDRGTGRKHLLAPSLHWRISEGVSLYADFERFTRLEDGLTSGVPLIYEEGVAQRIYPGLPWKFNYAGSGDYQDFISEALTLELDARLGGHVHLRAAYIDSGWDMEWRATGQGATGLVSQATLDHYYPASAQLTPADAMIRRNRWEHQWGGERSVQLDLAGTWKTGAVTLHPLIGVKRNLETFQRNLQRNNTTEPGAPLSLRPWDLRNPDTWDRDVPFGVEALRWVADNGASSTGTSAYAVVSASTADGRLHALAGYSQHRVANDRGVDNLGGPVPPASDRSRGVPQVGAIYRASREMSYFLTYSESFLANASMLRVDNVPTSPASPSIGRGWEAGMKLELASGRLSGTVSAYGIDAAPTGIITVTTGIDANGTTLFTDIQGGSQRSRGVELELFIEPVDDLQIFASWGLCDAFYAVHPRDPAMNGARLVAAPTHVASAWFKYIAYRSEAARVSFTGGFNRVGGMAYIGNNPSARLPAYTTVDLGLGCSFRWSGRTFTADVLVKNIADTRYYASNSSWGFPRHAILTLGTRF